MKVRTLPFGYCLADGKVVTHPHESQIVREVCSIYLQGKSMLQIAEWLNEKAIEYMPGVIAWNKARIMRILEDKRYLGDDKFPVITEQEVHDKILKLKYERNDQKAVDRKSDFFKINVPVKCSKCGSIMKRKKDSRRLVSSRWVCTNNGCNISVRKSDEALLSDITEILNELIANPHIITIPVGTESEPSIELIRLNNEISRLFDSPQIDREVARAKMLEYASLKYQETDLTVSITQQLHDIFTEAVPLQSFCPHLFDRTVDEIRLHTDGTIGIVLTNKQEIKKGGQNGTS